MSYETGDYFRENEEDSVKGFTIIGVVESSDEYQLAEKWAREGGEDSWIQYHIPAEKLEARLSDEKCEYAGSLTDEQYAAVCGKVDHPEVTPEKTAA